MSELDSCTLAAVLDGGEIEKMFTIFCTARLCVENLQFYQRAVAYRQLLGFKQRPLRKSGAGKDRAERAERREEREKKAQPGESKKEQPTKCDATPQSNEVASTSGDILNMSSEKQREKETKEGMSETVATTHADAGKEGQGPNKMQASDSRGAIHSAATTACPPTGALVVSSGEEHVREMRRLAQEIFDEFLGPNSETPINVPAHILKDVKRRMEEGVDSAVFDSAIAHIKKLIEQDPLFNFMTHPPYVEWKEQRRVVNQYCAIILLGNPDLELPKVDKELTTVRNDNDTTILHCLAFKNYPKVMQSFIAQSKVKELDTMVVNERHLHHGTALHIASSLGHVACVTILLSFGADATIKNARGKTPVEVATTEASEVFEVFSKTGVKGLKKKFPLHFADDSKALDEILQEKEKQEKRAEKEREREEKEREKEREREEKERKKEREREEKEREREEKGREKEEKRAKKELESEDEQRLIAVAACLERRRCTYTVTGCSRTWQFCYTCVTCYESQARGVDEMGKVPPYLICESCVEGCHASHLTKLMGPTAKRKMFCCCGFRESECKLLDQCEVPRSESFALARAASVNAGVDVDSSESEMPTEGSPIATTTVAGGLPLSDDAPTQTPTTLAPSDTQLPTAQSTSPNVVSSLEARPLPAVRRNSRPPSLVSSASGNSINNSGASNPSSPHVSTPKAIPKVKPRPPSPILTSSDVGVTAVASTSPTSETTMVPSPIKDDVPSSTTTLASSTTVTSTTTSTTATPVNADVERPPSVGESSPVACVVPSLVLSGSSTSTSPREGVKKKKQKAPLMSSSDSTLCSPKRGDDAIASSPTTQSQPTLSTAQRKPLASLPPTATTGVASKPLPMPTRKSSISSLHSPALQGASSSPSSSLDAFPSSTDSQSASPATVETSVISSSSPSSVRRRKKKDSIEKTEKEKAEFVKKRRDRKGSKDSERVDAESAPEKQPATKCDAIVDALTGADEASQHTEAVKPDSSLRQPAANNNTNEKRDSTGQAKTSASSSEDEAPEVRITAPVEDEEIDLADVPTDGSYARCQDCGRAQKAEELQCRYCESPYLEVIF